MSLIVARILNHTRKIFGAGRVITHSLIKRTEHVVIQRRRVGHDLEQALAMFDHFSDLETVPPSFFFTKHRICRDIKIENAFDFTRLCATSKEPDNEAHPGEKHHDHGWNSHRVEHRHNHNNRDCLRHEFPSARHNSSTSTSLCNLCVLCVSVVISPWRHREHRGCTEKNAYFFYFFPRRAMIAAPACSVESCP